MTDGLKEILWQQFGATIEMLRNVISKCPDTSYEKNKRFFYIAYHTVMLLDFYLTIPPEDFAAKLPFSIREADQIPEDALGDMIPDRIYSRIELMDYTELCRQKCKDLIAGLTDERLTERFTEGSGPDDMDYPILEILLYNMRHVQHHVGQLNMLLRQDLNLHVEWIFRSSGATIF